MGSPGYDFKHIVQSDELNLKKVIITEGAITYICRAKFGTATSAAAWQILRYDESTPGTVTLMALDGNDEFDNIQTEYKAAGRTYS